MRRPIPPGLDFGLPRRPDTDEVVRALDSAFESAGAGAGPSRAIALCLDLLVLLQRVDADDRPTVAAVDRLVAQIAGVKGGDRARGVRTCAVVLAHLAPVPPKSLVRIRADARRAGGVPGWAKDLGSTTVELVEERATYDEGIGAGTEILLHLRTGALEWAVVLVASTDEDDGRWMDVADIVALDRCGDLVRECDPLRGYARRWVEIDHVDALHRVRDAITTDERCATAPSEWPWPARRPFLQWLLQCMERSGQASDGVAPTVDPR